MATGKQRTEAGVLRYHMIRERAAAKLVRFMQKIAGPLGMGLASGLDFVQLLTSFALDEVREYAKIQREVQERIVGQPNEARRADTRVDDLVAELRKVEQKMSDEAMRAMRAMRAKQEQDPRVGISEVLRGVANQEKQAGPEKQHWPITPEDEAQAQKIFDAFRALPIPDDHLKEAAWKGMVAEGLRDYRVKLFLDHDKGCYGKAKAKGEPTFTLRAQDGSASAVIGYWIKRNLWAIPPAKIEDAVRVMREFQMWTGPVKSAD